MKQLIILTILLLAIACNKKITTTTVSTNTLDSTFIEERVRFDTIFIVGDTVILKEWIECDSLTNKPKPFKAFGKAGRASVRLAVKKNGDLTVVSACDSLSKLVAVKDKEIYRLRQEKEKKVVTITVQPSKLRVWFDMTCRILAGLFILLILLYVGKKFIKPL